jgi:polyisoprenoid-binding protein YceI
MTATAEESTSSRSSTADSPLRIIAILIMVAGVLLAATGLFTWFNVKNHLNDEHITVSEDANHFGGQTVDGPFTAYEQAATIQKHALEATGGQTYAQLGRDDPLRDTAMTASFLRASLFTSVVAFGIAAMAAGLGIVLILIGWALLRMNDRLVMRT